MKYHRFHIIVLIHCALKLPHCMKKAYRVSSECLWRVSSFMLTSSFLIPDDTLVTGSPLFYRNKRSLQNRTAAQHDACLCRKTSLTNHQKQLSDHLNSLITIIRFYYGMFRLWTLFRRSPNSQVCIDLADFGFTGTCLCSLGGAAQSLYLFSSGQPLCSHVLLRRWKTRLT